jgi:ribose transport system substrate-binding protein
LNISEPHSHSHTDNNGDGGTLCEDCIYMHTRRHAAVWGLLPIVFLSSCARSDRKTIAVVPKATSHLFWQTVQSGALKAGQDLKVNVEWNGAATETDYSRQIQIVDSMIARRVDGIAIAASDRNALNASLDRAASLHIPVTIFDSGVDSDQYMTFVATNNYEAGQMAARKLSQLLQGKGRILVIMHMPGSRSTMEREQGFYDTLKKESPAIQVVGSNYSMSDRSKAMGVTENLLTANSQVEGIFASSEPSSVGAALAIKERRLSGKVKFVAFDASEGLVEDLKGGTIDALVAQDPFKIGYEAVATLVEKLNGKNPPKRMDLSAVVVTRENLSRPEIQALLFPDVKKYLR